MRKLFILLSICISYTHLLQAQTSDDRAQLLQLCIDLPEIQANYPTFENESKAAAYIMQYPLTIPENLPIHKFEKKPVYMTRSEIYDNHVDAYFLFKQIEIGSESAQIEFTMYSNYNSNTPQIVDVYLNFQKSSTGWLISNQKLENK
ncbi:hypothetical protein [Mangrovibacterium marinum]|uniref:Uncharacterized protein n=1 Tax=Mangrovibacterium marinum TaxID=1639118 RepID=A0A2T5C2V2_9BACT|nr:hypothetical protein [Mangrovibacterium marinum]PTN09038.1 hypothetical protein C8N47_106138 [Mangrovibacterium marinum]